MLKTINDNPTIADQILFEILTPDANDCFSANPFKVNNVTISFIANDFVDATLHEYDKQTIDPELLQDLSDAKAAACLNPTAENLAKIEKIQQEIDSAKKINKIFYKEAKAIEIFGDDLVPAWLSTDTDNALIQNVPFDGDGNAQSGHFELIWSPFGAREGNYFICWTWTPNPAGESISAHYYFTLGGSTALTTSIPTHFTKKNKYETLFERYTAETFKVSLQDGDISPQVISEFGKAIAGGFTFIEDLANQTIDLIDANATGESLLPLLGNFFNLRLKSNDPTLWRRQIKRAMPLYKQKGTLKGLTQAFGDAGMKLVKFTKLWQVISAYTYQEAFVVVDDNMSFTLKYQAVLPVDASNFELYYRSADSEDWVALSSDYVVLSEVDEKTIMTWVGDELSVNPIILEDGDSIRVLYEVVSVPAPQQAVEEYIRSLPLSDQRDERAQDYPPKNWNVRLIEEDDPLFDIIVTNKNPYADPLLYGWIRTEFAFSENIYNMDEYNGSIRESSNPCDIDKSFIDSCKFCQSSKFNVDVEIEELSNDRILEAIEVINEYTPFHAVLNSINISGVVNEFINAPVETIQALIQMNGQEITIVSGQDIFNRVMMPASQVNREALASAVAEATGEVGGGANSYVIMYAPDVNFSSLGVKVSSNFLEVLSPSINSGGYTVNAPQGNQVTIASGPVLEPVNSSQFTFRLSNELFVLANASITQENSTAFTDEELDFAELGTKTTFDIDNDSDYTGGAWKISVPSFASPNIYTIANVLPNDILVLEDPSNTLPTTNTNNISYYLLDDNNNIQGASNSGRIVVSEKGLIDVANLVGPGGPVGNIAKLIKLGDYILYSGTQYKISKIASSTEFYIDDYNSGTVVGVAFITAYRRLADNQIGQFSYRGQVLTTSVDHEATLGILNGVNAPTDPNDIIENDHFKENFIVVINPLSDPQYYAISEIDGTNITLSGPYQEWTIPGTAVTYDLLRFEQQPVTILPRTEPEVAGHAFTSIDRRGSDVVEYSVETAITISALNAAKHDQVVDFSTQSEHISYYIEWANGNTENGEI